MEISGRIARQILLFSLVVLIIPIIIFPERFGMDLAKASLINAMYELIFYGLVIYIFNQKVSLFQLFLLAGICLIYRFILGLILGLLIVVMYPMSISIAVTLGMSSYLPAIFLHILATPFIIKPIIINFLSPPSSDRTIQLDKTKAEYINAGITSISVSKEKGFSGQRVPAVTEKKIQLRGRKPYKSSARTKNENIEANGFEKASQYIGDDGSVQLAVVIDNEGLLLANFVRGDYEPEDWAPFALLLMQRNDDVLSRLGLKTPEKMEILFKNKKITVACEELYSLMVISERAIDDVLNIRINKGLEIIRNYIAERYSNKLIGNLEKSYV